LDYDWQRRALLASLLILWTLVKPSIVIPFLWLVVFIPYMKRWSLMITFGYVALTLFAASFQNSSLFDLFAGWLSRGSAEADLGYANLTTWFAGHGAQEWGLAESAASLGALCIWI
jgi:hypothetical protein